VLCARRDLDVLLATKVKHGMLTVPLWLTVQLFFLSAQECNAQKQAFNPCPTKSNERGRQAVYARILEVVFKHKPIAT